MRTRVLALIAGLFAALTPLSAKARGLEGFWRMDDPLEGMQAVLEVYTCGDKTALCGKIAAVVGPNIDRQDYLNNELLRGLEAQRDGTYKGKLKMPVGRLPALNAVVQKRGRDSIHFQACFLGQCRSGTMSRLQ